MRYADFVQHLRAAYEHRGGIKTLRLGQIDPAWFAEIQRDALHIIHQASASDVTAAGHVTNWTRPSGTVKQFSLFNTSGQSEDTQGDYGYLGDAKKKRLVFPQLKGIARFAGLFGESLRNLRLNGMGTASGLSAHEENSISAHATGTQHIVRFHLPVFTNPEAWIYLDDERFQYKEGNVYFFHHGCVHAASNNGPEPRYHLVLDCFLDRTLFGRLFPNGPSPDPGFHKSQKDEAFLAGAPYSFPEFVAEGGRVITQGITYGRKAPTIVDYYRRNYPSAFKLFGAPSLQKAAAPAQS